MTDTQTIPKETVPQLEYYRGMAPGPKGKELAITVNIEGAFPHLRKKLALDPADEKEEGVDNEQKVVWFIWYQLLGWHDFFGTWLGAGDEVEHYDDKAAGVFAIVRRTFTQGAGRQIEFTVRFRTNE